MKIVLNERSHRGRIEIERDASLVRISIWSDPLTDYSLFQSFSAIFWNAICLTMFIFALRDKEYGYAAFISIGVFVGLYLIANLVYCWFGVFRLVIDSKRCIATWSTWFLKYQKKIESKSIFDVVEELNYSINYKPIHGVRIKYERYKNLDFGPVVNEGHRDRIILELRSFLNMNTQPAGAGQPDNPPVKL